MTKNRFYAYSRIFNNYTASNKKSKIIRFGIQEIFVNQRLIENKFSMRKKIETSFNSNV